VTGMEKLLLKPMEAAQLISCGRAVIYKLIADGTIPSVRLSGTLRVPMEGLRQWVAAQHGNASELKVA